jgi:streptogramin lyase
MQGPTDPSTTRLIREYVLPSIPVTGLAYLGPARTPFDVAYDSNGYAWITDMARDTIYQLIPATNVSATSTTALEWVLPNNFGKRTPLYIVSDDLHKVVWFTDPTSYEISRLNWSSGRLDDWYLKNITKMPLDIVNYNSTDIWFTGMMNTTAFYEFRVNTDTFVTYTMNLPAGPANLVPTRISANKTCIFLTDSVFDALYEVPLPATTAYSFPLTHPGFTWDVDVDPSNNVWVTQPKSSLIDEQLTTGKAKATYTVKATTNVVQSTNETLKPDTLNIGIKITTVIPSAYTGPLNTTSDPYVVWSIPTGVTAYTYAPPPAKPWDVATSADGYAWFTDPVDNHVDVIQPSTGTILLYAVPTAQSYPLSMDIQSASPANQYHVWFTEYHSGQIGELFNSTSAFDVTVCPSLPSVYPPPPPGSIRWTTSEIWFDSHGVAEAGGVSNNLYARVANLGPTAASVVNVSFYWYKNTSYNIAYNYVPLPPSVPSAGSWAYIGSEVITSVPPGWTSDVFVSWTIPATVPTNFTIAVQVSAAGDSNLYDNVAYANFTSVTPLTQAGPPTSTIIGIVGGFIAGAIVGGAIIHILRRPRARVTKR